MKKVEREKNLGNFFHSVWALVLVTLSQNWRVLRISVCVCHSARFGVSHCVEFQPADRRGKKW